MAILEFEAFSQFLADNYAKKGAILCLDNGSKNIGAAISDLSRTIASPTAVIKRQKLVPMAADIFKVFDQKECIAIIIGNPLNMDASSGPSAQAARAFARNLLSVRDVPMLMADERLSTAAVQRQMIDADITRNKRAAMVDSAASAFVLQGVLDRLKNSHYN